MDKIIKKKTWTKSRITWVSLASIFAILVLYNVLFGDRSTKFNVRSERITMDTVIRDYYQDYITQTGNVNPIKTIFLDALEGGRVEEVLVEEGSMVEKDQVILRLSNTNLHLNIMNREASLAEQMNNLRNTRLSMEQNKLNIKKQLLEIDYQLEQEKRSFENNKKLFQKKFISKEEFQESEDTYHYLKNKKDLLIETQVQDSLFRRVQIEQLEDSVDRMQDNLQLVRQKLESLNFKAPVSGQLASINAEIGEAKNQGERLGQINILDSYKIQADIDEHYISRISKGLFAEFDFNNDKYKLEVKKVYTVVRNGRFSVDMEFIDDVPNNIRIGQSFRVRIELGEPQEAILIPRGGFYQTTGGQWIYVVHESGDYAYKRPIRLNRQNSQYYEVMIILVMLIN